MGDDVKALEAQVQQLRLVIAQEDERYEAAQAAAESAQAAAESAQAAAESAQAALERERALRRAAEERAALAVPAGAAPRSASGTPVIGLGFRV